MRYIKKVELEGQEELLPNSFYFSLFGRRFLFLLNLHKQKGQLPEPDIMGSDGENQQMLA